MSTDLLEPSDTAVQRLLTCLPSRQPESDWRITDSTDVELPGDEDLPPSFDLREDWWKVSDQLTTGSCVGWAIADSVLRWHFVKTGKLSEDQLLSPRFIWMAAKETDEYTSRPESFIEDAGTSLKSALDVVRKFGCVPESLLPFDSSRMYLGNSRAFYMSAAQYRIAMYIRLQSIRQWKQWLVSNGPIAIRVNVDRNWHTCTDGRLEYYDPIPVGKPGAGGHAAAIVGYTEAGEFVIRNSWGEGWGDSGFALATAFYADKAITEAYGVFL